MKTEELLYELLNATDNEQKKLLKSYYIKDLSLRQIIEETTGINKYTIAKYLNIQKQSKIILSHLLSYKYSIEDNNYKDLVLTTIKRSYQTPNSNLRVSKNNTKILVFFKRFLDFKISLTELPTYLGFITFIKANNIHIYKNNINTEYKNLINEWHNTLLIRLQTKDLRYIPFNYKSGQNVVLKYFLNILFNTKVPEYDILLDNYCKGIKLYILTRYKPEKIEVSERTERILSIEKVRNTIDNANQIVLTNFKNKFKKK